MHMHAPAIIMEMMLVRPTYSTDLRLIAIMAI